jgi:hypothetical protein
MLMFGRVSKRSFKKPSCLFWLRLALLHYLRKILEEIFESRALAALCRSHKDRSLSKIPPSKTNI